MQLVHGTRRCRARARRGSAIRPRRPLLPAHVRRPPARRPARARAAASALAVSARLPGELARAAGVGARRAPGGSAAKSAIQGIAFATIVVARNAARGGQLEQQVGARRRSTTPQRDPSNGELGVPWSASRKPPGARRRSRPRPGCRATAARSRRRIEAEARLGRVLRQREPPRLARVYRSVPLVMAKPTSSTLGGRKDVEQGARSATRPSNSGMPCSSTSAPRAPRARPRPGSGGPGRRGPGTRAGRRALGSTWLPSAPPRQAASCMSATSSALPGPERARSTCRAGRSGTRATAARGAISWFSPTR